MRIDATHRSWGLATAALLAAATVAYVLYASNVTLPSGGSFVGIVFGIVGFAMMLFAGLLGARRKVRIWRLGRAQSWMRGHLWLGALSLPIILFHAGLTFGGVLTFVLMWLFVIVVLSGLLGAYLQHVMPKRLLRDVPMETIYEQIDHVRGQLLEEADTVVAEACGKLEVETVATGAGAAAAALASTVRIEADETAPLRIFYMRDMRPFVEAPAKTHVLANPSYSALAFEKVRALVPAAYHPAIADLENICEEERQLMRQGRLHRILHGWQLVHVPLSIGLLVLAVVHIVMALRY